MRKNTLFKRIFATCIITTCIITHADYDDDISSTKKSDLIDQIDSLKKRLSELDDDFSHFEKEQAGNNKISDAKIAHMVTQIADILQKYSNLKKSMASRDDSIAKLINTVREQEKTIDHLSKSTQKNHAALTAKIDALSTTTANKLQELSDALSTIKTNAANLEIQIQACKASTNQTKEAQEHTTQKHQSMLDELKMQFSSLQQEIANFNKKLKESQHNYLTRIAMATLSSIALCTSKIISSGVYVYNQTTSATSTGLFKLATTIEAHPYQTVAILSSTALGAGAWYYRKQQQCTALTPKEETASCDAKISHAIAIEQTNNA